MVLALGALAATTSLLGRRQPELTPARVIQDLDKDLLVFRFSTEPEEWATTKPCESKATRGSSVDEERDAAIAAGWIERVCRDDPTRMRLTAEGRKRSPRWDRYHSLDSSVSWSATVARYQRAGVPIVSGEPSPIDPDTGFPQRFVTIPGRYISDEDGDRLFETGWRRIRAVDRVERYTLWDGVWARRHGVQ